MDDTNPTAEAIAVKDDKIVAIGKKQSLVDQFGKTLPPLKLIDLKGKTLLPGFIDGHSHFINSLMIPDQANCYSPPAGRADSVQAILDELMKLKTEKKIPDGREHFIMGYGYDVDGLKNPADGKPWGKDLTAADLDSKFPNNPVVVGHVSLHGAVLNSMALELCGITAETQAPPGGIIARIEGSQKPAGLLMETAFLQLVMPHLPVEGDEDMLKRFKAGQEIFTSAGITTAQEGATHIHDLQLLQKAAENKLLFIDVVAYPFITDAEKILADTSTDTFGKYKSYQNRLRLGGVKITTDGSPQGKTAFFTTPYLTGGPTGETNWCGEPTFSKEETFRYVRMVYDHGLQLFIHCNGDAAIDLFLEAHRNAAKESESRPAHDDHPLPVCPEGPVDEVCGVPVRSLLLHGAHVLLRRDASQEPG